MININYIKSFSKKIIINDESILHQTIDEYFDYLLLQQLTNLKGRIAATKKLYGYKKLVPIYINSSLVFFPINNLKEYDNIYINARNIVNIYEKGSKTVIEFMGTDKLYVNKSYNQIIKYYNRSLSINHNS